MSTRESTNGIWANGSTRERESFNEKFGWFHGTLSVNRHPGDSFRWEPRENLQCIDLLEEFEKEFPKREKTSRRKLKSPERSTPKQQQSTSKQQPAPESQETTRKEEEVFTKDNFSLHGKQLKCIVGLTKTPGDLHFLRKFTDDTARLILAKEVNSRFGP
ncbi:unnamed protein product [Caenorhabditis nigoni]